MFGAADYSLKPISAKELTFRNAADERDDVRQAGTLGHNDLRA
jgi:hypothetical protein